MRVKYDPMKRKEFPPRLHPTPNAAIVPGARKQSLRPRKKGAAK